MKLLIAAVFAIGASSYGREPLKLENYSIDNRILDAVVSNKGMRFRFERVHAHSESGRVVFVVVTETTPSGEARRTDWLVASEESGLTVKFDGWTGTRISWVSRADWGGHRGCVDVARPNSGIQVLKSWDV